ncbi:protease FtsH subunit HflC [Thiogranum longum]|uniref:Protein HflC n=1 Tax=Thiogranum longum TaxID=1537524 RepID=A0A4R1HE97_9GAMM|nr:protease modulator HflC [Thiogranum longum]TCK19051.1 protease FtsH subunit HflC [Thiogranum longum]
MVNGKGFILVLALVALVIGSFSMFTVSQWEKAIMFRLGEIREADFKPGLHFKIPFINNVRKFDARILTLDVEPERFLTAEKKNVIVDSFVMWRVADVTRYYTAVSGDERHARLRLEQIIKDGMRGQFSKRTINEVVSGERDEIMRALTAESNEQAQEIGIAIADVRIKRIDLPAEVSNSVYRRMQAERARVAKEFRSRGFEEAEKIRADADRKRQVIIAEAYRDAEQVRGEGDATAAEIYAKAYGKDKEFYNFHRSMEAYRASLGGSGDMMLLSPDSEFFRYFGKAGN